MNWGALIVDIEPAGTVTLLDFFKLFVGDETTDNDDAYNRALEVAGQATEVYLDRVIAKREVTEYFPHHFGTVILHDPQVDTTQPVTVTLDGDTQTDYSVWLQRGKVGHLSRTGWRQDAPMDWRTYAQVEVTYTAGYDPLPSDVVNALCYTASALFKTEGTGAEPGGASGDVKSMSLYDVGSMSFDVGSSSGSSSGVYGAQGVITDTSAQLLSRYKRVSA